MDPDVCLTAPLQVFMPVWRGDVSWRDTTSGGG
jgi:hypothetical protein